MTVWKPEYCSEYTLSTQPTAVGREISVDCDCRYMLKLCHFNLGAEDFSNLYRVVRAHAHASQPASRIHCTRSRNRSDKHQQVEPMAMYCSQQCISSSHICLCSNVYQHTITKINSSHESSVVMPRHDAPVYAWQVSVKDRDKDADTATVMDTRIITESSWETFMSCGPWQLCCTPPAHAVHPACTPAERCAHGTATPQQDQV